MGMSGGGNKNGVQSEINVTPLIDVLLVLLIIFLVVMPIMMKMETLEVPRKLNTDIEMPDPNSIQLTISVKNDGSFYFNDGDKDRAGSDPARRHRADAAQEARGHARGHPRKSCSSTSRARSRGRTSSRRWTPSAASPRT